MCKIYLFLDQLLFGDLVKLEGLSREPIIIDEMGRLTVPSRFRDALGLPRGVKYPLWVEAYPDLKSCKSLIIRK